MCVLKDHGRLHTHLAEGTTPRPTSTTTVPSLDIHMPLSPWRHVNFFVLPVCIEGFFFGTAWLLFCFLGVCGVLVAEMNTNARTPQDPLLEAGRVCSKHHGMLRHSHLNFGYISYTCALYMPRSPPMYSLPRRAASGQCTDFQSESSNDPDFFFTFLSVKQVFPSCSCGL